jgi:hypothetical protein
LSGKIVEQLVDSHHSFQFSQRPTASTVPADELIDGQATNSNGLQKLTRPQLVLCLSTG